MRATHGPQEAFPETPRQLSENTRRIISDIVIYSKYMLPYCAMILHRSCRREVEESNLSLKIMAFHLAAVLLALSTCAAASVVINEIETNPPEGGADWIEIYNTDNESVDISGWTAGITDGSWTGEFPAVPAGTMLQGHGFYVFNGQATWNHDDGGYASLYNAQGGIVDRSADIDDGLNNDFTYGRHPDGHDTDTDGDWGLGSATRGESNTR